MPVTESNNAQNQTEDVRPQLERLRKLAWGMDSSIGIPGTRWSFGLDALIGLIPGIGDAAGLLISMYIIVTGARLGASRSTLLRMLGNVGIDALAGTIPVLGDLMDAGWKANQRNVKLLEAELMPAPEPAPVITKLAQAKQDKAWPVLMLGGLGLLAYVALMAFILWKVLATDISL